jgi:eukaryotic-like serine/threonine-protein kinase
MTGTVESASVLTGRRFGAYELHELIGAGGMGEVYRATDLRLHRSVAIKVLPKALRLDADRVARLGREAQMLAALNHPNIATIHGFEDAFGMHALVLELVDGPTLAEHLAVGTAPLHEVMVLARQIAQALQAAHDHGIIHRDLKPANIKLRSDGVIKLLDFGLARLHPANVWTIGVAGAPTISAAGTHEGTVVGTPAYMSPEQARGADIDERTDTWAFGCLLYLLLTGREPFRGASASDIIAAILGQEPDWSALPMNTPAPLHRLVRRCLVKDRHHRLRDLGEALADLDEAETWRVSGAHNATNAVRRRFVSGGRVALATVGVVAILGTVALWSPLTPSPSAIRFSIAAPTGLQITPAVPAVSPDGQTLVFSACSRCDTEDLDNWVPYRRSLDQFQAVAIPEAKGAFSFFFSPDGRSIGFCTRDGLKKISSGGGPPVTLYEGIVIGADWGPDDTIVFASGAGLMRVSAAGGTPQPLTSPRPGTVHVWPSILPGAEGVLFTEWDGPAATGAGQIAVVSFDRRTERRLLKGSGARISPSGHLIFTRDRSLWAAPFDGRSLKVTGEAVPVSEAPALQSQFGGAVFTVGRNGTLAFLTRAKPKPAVRTLTWVRRGKREQPLNVPPASYGWPRVSPDGAHIALDIVGPDSTSDIWIYDIARATLSKLTDGRAIHLGPVWTRNSQEVVFTTGPPFSFLSKPVAGAAPARHIVTTNVPGALAAGSWSRDGALLFSYLSTPRMGDNPAYDIGLVPSGHDTWKPLLASDAAEVDPVISPAGNWIAYSSNRTGQFEVYLERFPELGSRQMVSTSGGLEPLWSPNGKEIFYRSLDGRRLLALPFDPRSGVHGRPITLFEGAYASYLGGLRYRSYDVTPDGEGFVMVKDLPASRESVTAQIDVVLNWSEGLKRH